MDFPSKDDFENELAQQFLLDYSSQLGKLRNSIIEKNSKVISDFAHRVKGTASVFGFTEIATTLDEIERRIPLKNWQEIESLYDHLVKLFEKETSL